MNVSALTHYFIPQESNNHRAKLIQSPILVVLLALFVISQQAVHVVKQDVLGYASQISTEEVIKLTNAKRQAEGLSAVVENQDLDQAALEKGKDMLAKGYWAHVAPDGTQPWDFFKSVGYKYRFAGENLARDFTNPAAAVDAWMASPSHRENMLSDRYKEIGVAVVEGSLAGKDATIIVQLFGTKMNSTAQVSPVSAKSESEKASATQSKPIFEEKTQADDTTSKNSAPQVPTVVTQASTQGDLVPSLNISRMVSFGVVGILLLALLIDSGVIWYKGMHHSRGKPFAQIAFLGMILALIVIIKAGQVL